MKTKERLKRALLDLLEERGLEEISISEICDKAKINRNTFYSHYQSVKDLLEEVEAQFLEDLMGAITISSDSIRSVTGLLSLIFAKVRENSDMCTLLFSEHGDRTFLRSILLFALPNAVSNWSDSLMVSEDDARTLFFFISGGAVSVIEEWVRDGFAENEENVVRKLDAMIMHAQTAFTGTGIGLSSC